MPPSATQRTTAVTSEESSRATPTRRSSVKCTRGRNEPAQAVEIVASAAPRCDRLRHLAHGASSGLRGARASETRAKGVRSTTIRHRAESLAFSANRGATAALVESSRRADAADTSRVRAGVKSIADPTRAALTELLLRWV